MSTAVDEFRGGAACGVHDQESGVVGVVKLPPDRGEVAGDSVRGEGVALCTMRPTPRGGPHPRGNTCSPVDGFGRIRTRVLPRAFRGQPPAGGNAVTARLVARRITRKPGTTIGPPRVGFGNSGHPEHRTITRLGRNGVRAAFFPNSPGTVPRLLMSDHRAWRRVDANAQVELASACRRPLETFDVSTISGICRQAKQLTMIDSGMLRENNYP